MTDTSDQAEAAGAEVILIATVADLRITAGPSCPIKVLGFQLRYGHAMAVARTIDHRSEHLLVERTASHYS